MKEEKEKEEEKRMGKSYSDNWKQEILMDQVLGWHITSRDTRLFKTEYRNISSDTDSDQVDGEAYVTPKEALKRKEFYMLWVTRSPHNLLSHPLQKYFFRFCAVLITQSVSGFYKAFGQSFIADDHFLSFVGAVSSVFNCTGRLFYGILMDRFLS